MTLALVVVACLVSVHFDLSLKSSSAEGFCPADAKLVVAASDFAAFWEKAVHCDVGRQATARPPIQFRRLEVAIRNAAGIRPTPVRWRLWLGNRLLAATGETGSGLCVRPGLLLRAVHLLRRFLGVEAAEEGMYRFGDFL
ncbi:MAG TPA: hypothetical protein HPP83_07535, partial [Candidatus Hydrogenedentes bacterium]|nr:hypothetical protein [Candidatus Hydrogenedentota bacterium]